MFWQYQLQYWMYGFEFAKYWRALGSMLLICDGCFVFDFAIYKALKIDCIIFQSMQYAPLVVYET